MNFNEAGSLRSILFVVLFAGAGCRGGEQGVLIFPHDKHAALGISCGDCHGERGGRIPAAQDCATCHAEEVGAATPDSVAALVAARGERIPFARSYDHEAGPARACEDCHEPAGAHMTGGVPASHTAAWRGSHGPVALVAGRACRDCHRNENFCASCHKETPPADHNQHFRLRGHGVVAGMNRERCVACHRQETCTACHTSTQPITHVASFRSSPTNGHCRSCHVPLSRQTCATCHFRFSERHPTAPAWPTNATHVSGASCRTCHVGPGAGLTHPDNGDDCELCHAK